jgi:hypothetical protein
LWLLFLGRNERKTYVNNPDSLDEIQENIKHEISAYPVKQLRRVSIDKYSNDEMRDGKQRVITLRFFNEIK